MRLRRITTGLAVLVLVTGVSAAPPVKQQSLENLGEYPPQGVSAVYGSSGRLLEGLLRNPARWEALPRPISGVKVGPDRPPAFAILRRDGYAAGGDEGRWSAEQSWAGNSLLLYDASFLAASQGDLWIQSRSGWASLRTHNRWVTIRDANTSGVSIHHEGRINLARDASGDWWSVGSSGLLRLEFGVWEKRSADGWFGGRITDVAGGPQGQILAWSPVSDVAGYGGVAVLREGAWSVSRLAAPGTWTHGAIRADGSVVLAGPSQVIVLPVRMPAPAAEGERLSLARKLWVESDPLKRRDWIAALLQSPGLKKAAEDMAIRAAVGRQASLALARLDEFCAAMKNGTAEQCDAAWQAYAGQQSELDAAIKDLSGQEAAAEVLRQLADGRYFGTIGPGRVTTAVLAMSPDGGVLVRALSTAGTSMDLLAIGADDRHYLLTETEIPAVFEATAYPGGRYLIRSRETTSDVLRLWRPGETKVEAVDSVPVGDKLLGADRDGRVYLDRGGVVMMLTPSAPAVRRSGLGYLGMVRTASPLAATVGDDGTLWMSNGKGKLRFLRRGDGALTEAKERLPSPVRELHSGRGGAVLAMCENGQAALVDRDHVRSATSLVDLARRHFGPMLAAAPKATRDERRWLTADWRTVSPPWLAVGEYLWLTEGGEAYRVSRDGKSVCVGDLVRALGYQTGAVTLMGPLASGQVLLAMDGQPMARWIVVTDPGGAMTLSRPEPQPPKGGQWAPDRPGTFAGQWLLDSRKRLWLHQASDGVYRVGDSREWTWLGSLGQPWLEAPAGTLWARRWSSVIPGYQTCVDGQTVQPRAATFVHAVTPLYGEAPGSILCWTPLGLARLSGDLDLNAKELSAPTGRAAVFWSGLPVAFVGHTGGWAFFVTTAPNGHSLLAVPTGGKEKP